MYEYFLFKQYGHMFMVLKNMHICGYTHIYIYIHILSYWPVVDHWTWVFRNQTSESFVKIWIDTLLDGTLVRNSGLLFFINGSIEGKSKPETIEFPMKYGADCNISLKAIHGVWEGGHWKDCASVLFWLQVFKFGHGILKPRRSGRHVNHQKKSEFL